MSTNKTTNLGLHSWVRSDRFSMDEFNENFTKLDQAVGEANTAAEEETQARQSALDAEIKERQNALSTEAAERQSADSAEAQARQSADDAEAQARKAADDAEAQARKAADDAEAQARKAADDALTAAITKNGNCKIELRTYTSNNSSARKVTFSAKPMAVLCISNLGMFFMLTPAMVVGAWSQGASGGSMTPSWSGNTLTWSGNWGNDPGVTYYLVALIEADKA